MNPGHARILVLCEYPTLGGGEYSLLAILDAVAQSGFEIIVAAPPQGPFADELRRRRVTHHPFSTYDSNGVRHARETLCGEIARLLAELRPSLLHANSLSMGRLAGPTAAECGLPSIAHLRDILKLSRAALADLNRHTRLIAVSHATREALVAQGLDGAKTQVVYNGVDLARFRPRPATGSLARELRIPEDHSVIGSIGQIILRKGHDVLARAAAELAAELPDAHYVIVGARYSRKDEALRHEENLHQHFAEAGLARRVHFLGPRDDVADLLPEFTMLVHPARQEPLGRVLLEAAAAGCAIIATDVGGTREIFPPATDSALLVPPDDSGALAAAMRRLSGDASRRAALGVHARQRAEKAFDARMAAEAMARHYHEVLADG